mgnify:CR=1 FL=1
MKKVIYRNIKCSNKNSIETYEEEARKLYDMYVNIMNWLKDK